MSVFAWIAVAAFFASVVARLAEPDKSLVRWNRASTWFSLSKELAMWVVVIAVLA